jgi:hypothetical protein
MDLASGYSDSINYGNGYTPLANNAIANNNANYAQQQAVMALMAQQAMDQHNAAIQAQGPSSGYGMVGGYPSFGDPAAPGTYSPGSGLSSFSGTPLGGAATWNPYAYGGSSGGIGSDAGQSPNQPDVQPQPQSQLPWFWQGVRDWTGMGTPGGSGYDPYAGLGNQGQPGVTDPMGYGSGGYQGNDIPYQNRAPVQGGTTDPFWQGIRDLAGADPKDQSRAPAYDPRSGMNQYMWNELFGGGGGGYQPQPAAPDPYYWSGNFWGANNGSGIGQGEGMAPGMGGFNNPGVPTSPQQWYGAGGYNPYDPQTYGGSAQQNLGWGQPNVSTPGVFDTGADPYQQWLQAGGYNAPSNWNSGGGGGYGGGSYNPYASQPWWSTFAAAAGPQGVSDWLAQQGISSGGGGVMAAGNGSPYGQPTGVGDSGYGGGWGGYAANNPWGYMQAPAPDVSRPASYWTANNDPNPWKDTRETYTSQLSQDPARMYDMAVRLYLEANNDTQGRQGIAEAMFNRNAARGANPLDPSYFPTDQDYLNKYAQQTRDLRNNPDLLGQIYSEIGRAAGGSNLSQGATDWASAGVADSAARVSTPTWTSPIEGERFFRKDLSNPTTGAEAARQVQDWYRGIQNWQAPQWRPQQPVWQPTS